MVRKILISAIVVLSLILAALLGLIWYQSTHFFVDGTPYANRLQELDLRDTTVSEEHFLQVQANLPDCKIYWNVPFQGSFVSSDAETLTIRTLNQEDIRILTNYFADLKRIDATGCNDYAMLSELAAQLPDTTVDYRIALGSLSLDPGTQDLTLENGTFVLDELMTSLPYLTRLERLHFPDAQLTLDQKEQLRQAFPQLDITTTVTILGREYDDTTTELDLSAITSADVEAVAAKIAMLPQLEQIQLTQGEISSQLSLAEMKTLKMAAPNATLRHSFQFYGIDISTEDEEVRLKRITVTEGANFPQELRDLLDVLDHCKRLVLDDKGPYDKLWKFISDEELATIREEYQERTKVVWRVYFGLEGATMTDAQALRAVSGLTEKNSKDLRYCNEVIYMDIGHNDQLESIEFISGMTNLEAVIVSGAPIKSLDPIAACKNLKFLEIANCIYLPDIEAVRECTQLEMLNISFTKIQDLSPITDLKLTHLCTVKNPHVSRNEPGEQLVAYMEANPACLVTYEGDQPYGKGWRTDEEGKLFGWYAKLEDVFHYSRYFEGGTIKNQTGWRVENQ